MFLSVSGRCDCSPGELWFLYSKIALSLFPSGKLQHINVIKYLWIVLSWPKIHIDFVIIPHGKSRFFLVSGCRGCSIWELWGSMYCDCSLGELWDFYDKLLLSLFPIE